MKLTILGSGTSHGIPVIGCDCPVCRSADPRDKRMRASLYIEGEGGERAVIDTGPEFRLQALRAGVTRLDAVFLTHAHADHLHGLDDIRPLSREKPIPVYGNLFTIAELRERFDYVFKKTQLGGGKPQIVPQAAAGPVALGNLVFTPIPVKHGILDILGWKISEGPASVLYLTDTSAIPPSSMPLLHGAKVLIIGGLRTRLHETHFSFEQALKAALETGAPVTYLTHLCHERFHREIEDYCRNFREERNVTGLFMGPAYDELEIVVSRAVSRKKVHSAKSHYHVT